MCVLLDMVRQMSEEQYSLLVKALEHESAGGSGSLISDALALMLELLQRPVFRPHWADMLHLQHYVMLHALRWVSFTIEGEILNGLTEAERGLAKGPIEHTSATLYGYGMA